MNKTGLLTQHCRPYAIMLRSKVQHGRATCSISCYTSSRRSLQCRRVAISGAAHRQQATRNSHVAGAAGSRPAGRELPSSGSGPAASKVKVVPLPAPSDVMYEEGEYVEVGKVAGAFGVLGEVRIEVSTDNPKARFGQAGKKIFLKAPRMSGLLAAAVEKEQGMLQLTTSSAKVQVLPRGEEAWILKFRELTDRSQAEQLLGYTLLIPVSDREALRDPDQFWVQDLVGCRVFQKSNGRYIGKVLDVYSGTGTHDTLLIQLAVNKDDVLNSRSRQCMVPFAKALCPHVDTNQKQMVVDPPEGLLDMFTYKKLKKKLTPEQIAEKLQALESSSPPVLDLQTLQERPGPAPRPRRASAWAKPSQKSAQATAPPSQKPTQAVGSESMSADSGRAGSTKVVSVQQHKAATNDDVSDEEDAVVKNTEEQAGHEDDFDVSDGEAEQESSSSSGSASALDRWKQRRRLGVSLASKKRRAL